MGKSSPIKAGAIAALVSVAMAGTAALSPAAAQAAAADFYKGKKIRFMVGTAAGGGFSSYALLLATHMNRHIPGNPAIVIEHMPGAGGINSLNYVASAGAKDGTVMAIAMPNFYITPFTEPKAVRFDPLKFRFIGRMSDFGRVLITWHGTGARTMDDLMKKEIALGASSRRSTTSAGPDLLNEALGAKMKIVTGYRGTGPTLIALEKGEVGATTVAWSTLSGLHPQWLRDKQVHVIAGMDRIPVPMKGVPRARDLIKDPMKRAAFDFIGLAAEFGTAVAVAPGVPAERTEILRKAFDATIRDKAFLAEANKRQMPINPLSGAELDKMFADSGSPSKEVVAMVARLMGIATK